MVFHLTGGMIIKRVKRIFESSDQMNVEEIAELLMGSLIHVPNHLAATSKIGLDIPVKDVFGVNSISESDDDQTT